MKIKEKLINRLKKVRDNYVINQVNRAVFPEFADDEIKRYRIVFSGRVQKIGFRLEVTKMAEKLELTGFCENLGNGDVLAELQGPENKIFYLISFMESLKRIKIRSKKYKQIHMVKGEMTFEKR